MYLVYIGWRKFYTVYLHFEAVSCVWNFLLVASCRCSKSCILKHFEFWIFRLGVLDLYFPAFIALMAWLFLSSQNLYVEVLSPIVTEFGDGLSKEEIKINWLLKVGTWSDRSNVLIRKDTREELAVYSPCEDTVRKVPVCKSEKKARIKNQPCWQIDLELRVSRTVRKYNFCCLNHLVCYFVMATHAQSLSMKCSFAIPIGSGSPKKYFLFCDIFSDLLSQ